MSPSPKQDTLSTSAVIASPADDDAIASESSSPRPLSLGDMPKEVACQIIENTMPEGFESLALTCKDIHALCKHYIKHHKMLCAQFKNLSFIYHSLRPLRMDEDPLWQPIYHSYALLERIAAEPIVGRYIQHADIALDSPSFIPHTQIDLEAPNDPGPVTALFANSSYLRRANLDWRQYYSFIAGEYSNATSDGSYMSSHAVAFVLTLLPNLRSLRLFWHWTTTGAPDKLVHTVISEARKSHGLQQHGASLAQLTRLQFEVLDNPFNLGLMDRVPFLALPRLRSFHQIGWRPDSIHHGNLAHNHLQDQFGEMLENVYITRNTMKGAALAEFLRLTPRLKTLYFNWVAPPNNVAQVLETLDREAGARMERIALLSIRWQLDSIITPPFPSFRRFQVLRELQLSFDFLLIALSFAVSHRTRRFWKATGEDLATKQVRFVDILPASLTQLNLMCDNFNRVSMWRHPEVVHRKILRPFFHGFAELKQERLPALEKIGLGYMWPVWADILDNFDWLIEELNAVNVSLSVDFPGPCYDWEDARWALRHPSRVGQGI